MRRTMGEARRSHGWRHAIPFACLVSTFIAAFTPPGLAANSIGDVVGALAQAEIDNGQAVGLGVAVVSGPGATPLLFAFGKATVGADGTTPFTIDTVTELGSVTKVFTTNLLGQEARAGTLPLGRPLGQLKRQLGQLKPLTAKVTLRDLGDFTGGFPSYAPECRRAPTVPGCLPSPRPVPGVYGAADFARYFRGALPYDFAAGAPAMSVPTAYNYSDYSIGLLGLLIGGDPRVPLGNGALAGWMSKVRYQILEPLRMSRTYLQTPAGLRQVALGYAPALATAVVGGGRITGVKVIGLGANYTTVPRVRIVGGGGSGAAATATVAFGGVQAIAVTKGGSGYIAPARITFSGGGSTTAAKAEAIVRNGKIVAAVVTDDGTGYQRAPRVVIAGGRNLGGNDATATARIANGRVVHLDIVDGGQGYVQPLGVIVAPGAGYDNPIPIWAAAGALSSSIRDMGNFAAAALGNTHIGSLRVPQTLSDGFKIAETAYACGGPSANPAVASCPQGNALSGLAWGIEPADPANRSPAIIWKDGGLPGYNTFIRLVPAKHLAVVVLANAGSTDDYTGKADNIAANLAHNIMATLLYR